MSQDKPTKPDAQPERDGVERGPEVTMSETADFFRAHPGLTIGGMIRLLLDTEAEVERLRERCAEGDREYLALRDEADDLMMAAVDAARERDAERARAERAESWTEALLAAAAASHAERSKTHE